MAIIEKSLERLERVALAVLLDWMRKEVDDYHLISTNDIERLKKALREGDVILVEGKRRLSRVIMEVTNSTWSHSVMYVGNGEVVEADDEGVIISPLEKYQSFNIRICRPVGLSRDKIRRAVDVVMEAIGKEYDTRGLTALLQWYLKGREDGGDAPSRNYGQEFCSGLIARAYAGVGLPVVEGLEPKQTVPRDFDLSPNFEIIKVGRALRRRHLSSLIRILRKLAFPASGNGNKSKEAVLP